MTEADAVSRRHFISLNYMRGVAALIVMYGHVFLLGMLDKVTPKTYLPMLTGAPLPLEQVPLGGYFLKPEKLANSLGSHWAILRSACFS